MSDLIYTSLAFIDSLVLNAFPERFPLRAVELLPSVISGASPGVVVHRVGERAIQKRLKSVHGISLGRWELMPIV